MKTTILLNIVFAGLMFGFIACSGKVSKQDGGSTTNYASTTAGKVVTSIANALRSASTITTTRSVNPNTRSLPQEVVANINSYEQSILKELENLGVLNADLQTIMGHVTRLSMQHMNKLGLSSDYADDAINIIVPAFIETINTHKEAMISTDNSAYNTMFETISTNTITYLTDTGLSLDQTVNVVSEVAQTMVKSVDKAGISVAQVGTIVAVITKKVTSSCANIAGVNETTINTLVQNVSYGISKGATEIAVTGYTNTVMTQVFEKVAEGISLGVKDMPASIVSDKSTMTGAGLGRCMEGAGESDFVQKQDSTFKQNLVGSISTGAFTHFSTDLANESKSIMENIVGQLDKFGTATEIAAFTSKVTESATAGAFSAGLQVDEFNAFTENIMSGAALAIENMECDGFDDTYRNQSMSDMSDAFMTKINTDADLYGFTDYKDDFTTNMIKGLDDVFDSTVILSTISDSIVEVLGSSATSVVFQDMATNDTNFILPDDFSSYFDQPADADAAADDDAVAAADAAAAADDDAVAKTTDSNLVDVDITLSVPLGTPSTETYTDVAFTWFLPDSIDTYYYTIAYQEGADAPLNCTSEDYSYITAGEIAADAVLTPESVMEFGPQIMEIPAYYTLTKSDFTETTQYSARICTTLDESAYSTGVEIDSFIINSTTELNGPQDPYTYVEEGSTSTIQVYWSPAAASETTAVSYLVAYQAGATAPATCPAESGDGITVTTNLTAGNISENGGSYVEFEGEDDLFILNVGSLDAETTYSFRICSVAADASVSTGVTTAGTTEGAAALSEEATNFAVAETDTTYISFTWTPSNPIPETQYILTYMEGGLAPADCTLGNTQGLDSSLSGIGMYGLLEPDTSYTFRLCVDDNGTVSEGVTSDPITTPALGPEPSSAYTSTASSSQIDLYWTAASPAPVSYTVAYLPGFDAPEDCTSGTVINDIGTTSKSVTGLDASTFYTFRICAFDGVDLSTGTTTYTMTMSE